MNYTKNLWLIGLVALLFAAATSVGTVLAGNNPIDENWWPSEFGADDERGAVNYITEAKVREAVKLVKQGKVASLTASAAHCPPGRENRHFKFRGQWSASSHPGAAPKRSNFRIANRPPRC